MCDEVKCEAKEHLQKSIVELVTTFTTYTQETFKNRQRQEEKKNANTVSIRKNVHGEFEHLPTHFVFDPQTQKVCARRKGDLLCSLTPKDIEECKILKFGVSF